MKNPHRENSENKTILDVQYLLFFGLIIFFTKVLGPEGITNGSGVQLWCILRSLDLGRKFPDLTNGSGCNFDASWGLLFFITFTTSGITSPALWTNTVSPILTSFRSISSWLCNVAFVTTTPPTLTGFNFATGVTAPVLPIDATISRILLVTCSALNLPAIAHLGDLLLRPRISRSSIPFTLKTVPSISYGKECRLFSRLLW